MAATRGPPSFERERKKNNNKNKVQLLTIVKYKRAVRSFGPIDDIALIKYGRPIKKRPTRSVACALEVSVYSNKKKARNITAVNCTILYYSTQKRTPAQGLSKADTHPPDRVAGNKFLG